MRSQAAYEAAIEEIESLPEVIPPLLMEFENAAAVIAKLLRKMPTILLTGCGDSAIACRAAVDLFNTVSGHSAWALDSMTLSRYPPLFPKEGDQRAVVIAVSYSGEVARTVEAAQRAKALGLPVVVLSADPDSRLGQCADEFLDTTCPSRTTGPGIASFVSSLLGLELLAAALGREVKSLNREEGRALSNELHSLGQAMTKTIELAREPAAHLAATTRALRYFEFFGSGPGRASARFGAAKLMEAAGGFCADEEIEEFFHLQYFQREPASVATILIAPERGASWSRAQDLMTTANELGRPLAVVSDAPVAPCLALPIASGIRESLSPILHVAPLAMFAAELMLAWGESPGRGWSGPWAPSARGEKTRNSTIQVGLFDSGEMGG